MSTLAQMVQTVYRNLRDLGDGEATQLVTDTEYEGFVASAINRYSVDHPRTIVASVVASGTVRDTLPTDWEDGFSVLGEVQYPADEVPPEVRDPRTYAVMRIPTGLRLTWLESTPTTSAAVWLAYTVRHTISTTASTFPDGHYWAVADLASAIAADSIAARYASTRDNAFGGEAVSARTKAQEWHSIAKRFEAHYRDALAASTKGASGRVNWDQSMSMGGDFLTHKRANR